MNLLECILVDAVEWGSWMAAGIDTHVSILLFVIDQKRCRSCHMSIDILST